MGGSSPIILWQTQFLWRHQFRKNLDISTHKQGCIKMDLNDSQFMFMMESSAPRTTQHYRSLNKILRKQQVVCALTNWGMIFGADRAKTCRFHWWWFFLGGKTLPSQLKYTKLLQKVVVLVIESTQPFEIQLQVTETVFYHVNWCFFVSFLLVYKVCSKLQDWENCSETKHYVPWERDCTAYYKCQSTTNRLGDLNWR